MQYSPQQIKDRLLRALDEDNNVVDMAQVLAVISILENYAITREALEQTRIGKTINELRKKTKNEELAKRAKRLVRSWQKLVSGGGDSATTNGDPGGTLQHPCVAMLQGSPRSRPNSPASVHSNISPGLPHSRPNTPLTPGAKSSLANRVKSRPLTPNSLGAAGGSVTPRHSTVSPKTLTASLERTSSPLTAGKGRSLSPAVSSGLRKSPSGDIGKTGKLDKSINKDVNHSNGNKTLSPAMYGCVTRSDGVSLKKRPRTDLELESSATKKLSMRGVVKEEVNSSQTSYNRFIKDTKHSPVNGLVKSDVKSGGLMGFVQEGHLNTGPTLHSNRSATVTSPSLGDSRDSSDSLSAKRNINFNVQSKSSDLDTPGKDRLVKPPKARVKTTAQLIAELQAKSDTVDGKMLERIASVEREVDDLNQSVVPAGALPRARRKPHEPVTPLPGSRGRGKLSPNKTELVEKFLLSSVATPSPVEDDATFKDEDHQNESPVHTEPSASFDSSMEVVGGRLENKPRKDLEDAVSLLPPLNLENIVWDEDYEVTERAVTDTDVQRISYDQWSGVNGCYDSAGRWRDWTQTLSLPSFEGDMLHILPYVNIDD